MFGFGSSSPKTAADAAATDAAATPTASTTDPTPAPRPGTSGTEALLTSNRRAAHTTLSKAARAERTYKTHKRAATARADWADAKGHYRAAWHHARDGSRMVLALVRGGRYVLADRRQRARERGDEQKRKKAAERRRKLEAQIAREAGGGGGDDGGSMHDAVSAVDA